MEVGVKALAGSLDAGLHGGEWQTEALGDIDLPLALQQRSHDPPLLWWQQVERIADGLRQAATEKIGRGGCGLVSKSLGLKRRRLALQRDLPPVRVDKVMLGDAE